MDPRPDFFTLEIDPSGRILSVLQQQGSFDQKFFKGEDLANLIEEGSLEKLARLFSALILEGHVPAWEMFLNSPTMRGHPIAVLLTGVQAEGQMLVFGGITHNDVESARQWLLANSQLFPKGMLAQLGQLPNLKGEVLASPETFDEMSRLYGELTTMQREVAKKQVELEQLNATVSQYATSLEDLVSERTRQLKESEARFRGIFEFSSIGIGILDSSGDILSANAALKSILRKIRQEKGTKNVSHVFYSKGGQDFKSIYQRLSAGEIKSHQSERVLDCADGRLCWVEVNFFVIPVEGGQMPIAVNLVEDITARKNSDQALIQAEKLTVVGKIAASLAHEINNPLQAIMGHLDLAEEALEIQRNGQKNLRIAREELKRISRIVSEMRSASRKVAHKPTSPMPIQEVVDRVARLIHKKCDEKGILLKIKHGASLPLVRMDEAQIEQVLLNLAMNAIEAISNTGEISIRTSSGPSPRGVQILIKNSGEPIPASARDHIYEPFFTTKKEGLGLGLHISKQIILAHSGTIELLDDQDLTCFRIFLPAAA